MSLTIPFDAVVFDLDGTLVATERYWPDAARAGARRAFRELGLERELPTTAEWMGLVGMGLEEGFDELFADLAPAARRIVAERCVQAEAELLRDGRADLLPGVREALEELSTQGVRLGIASNCHASYLAAMMHGLGLERWIAEGRCLETPGIANKADMVADLLQTFDTRRAVMVGDRSSDRDAGWANGLPHVHLARGYAAVGEDVAAEAVIDGMDALVPRLAAKARWVRGVLTELALPPGPVVLGVTGGPGAGKSLFARDLVEVAGRAAAAVSLDAFARDEPAAARDPRTALVEAFDVEALARELLDPHARGATVALERRGGRIEVTAGALLVLEGPFLLDPRVRDRVRGLLHLQADEEVALRRVAGRATWRGAPGLRAAFHEALALQRSFDALYPAQGHADGILDSSNALGPG